VVLFGEDRYSMGLALAKARKRFDPVDVMRLDPQQKSRAEVLLTVGTPGLFSSERLIILDGLGDAGKASGRRSAKAKDDQGLTLEDLRESTADSTTVVVAAAGAKRDAPLVKEALQLAKDAGAGFRVREFPAPGPADMVGWLQSRSKEVGLILEPPAAVLLAARVGQQLGIAGAELEKLRAASAPEGRVTEPMVEKLVPESAEESIFPLIDAIALRRRDTALRLLHRQLKQVASNESELSLRLLRLLARQFRILLQIRLLDSSGADRDAIVSRLKLPPYYAKRYFSQAKNLSDAQLRRGIETLAAVEQAIKNGESREAQLETLVADLTS